MPSPLSDCVVDCSISLPAYETETALTVFDWSTGRFETPLSGIATAFRFVTLDCATCEEAVCAWLVSATCIADGGGFLLAPDSLIGGDGRRRGGVRRHRDALCSGEGRQGNGGR